MTLMRYIITVGEEYMLSHMLYVSLCTPEACSWRPGSRCYPGSCPDTTTESCQCLQGLSGPDCDTSK